MPAPIVLTAGMGVGPEVALRALVLDGADDVVLAGRGSAIAADARALGVAIRWVDGVVSIPGEIAVLDTSDTAEPAEVAAIRKATIACLSGDASAIVTAPIHKMRLAEQGFEFPGHTGFIGHLCGVEDPVMSFVGGELRVALVTTHIPLSAVSAAITRDRVDYVVRTATQALRADLGLSDPRIAVCGVNPHAGEEGLLGREELETIGPACDVLRADGLDVWGPVSAETAFLAARMGRTDLVVAMYHDQGLAPLKAVEFGRSVNWSVGIPIVRTSVDHGTADDLVGTGKADPSSMRAALRLAREIVARRVGL